MVNILLPACSCTIYDASQGFIMLPSGSASCDNEQKNKRHQVDTTTDRLCAGERAFYQQTKAPHQTYST